MIGALQWNGAVTGLGAHGAYSNGGAYWKESAESNHYGLWHPKGYGFRAVLV